MKNRENRLYISESSERELRPVKVSAPFRRFGVVMSLGDRFEFTYYLRDSNYKIKPLEVMSVLLGTSSHTSWCWAIVQSLPWEISQGYPLSMKGALSQEKQEKVFIWSGGRDAVSFLVLIRRSPRKGTKKLKSGRTELEGRGVKVSFYIKNGQSRPLFKPWNFIILGPAGSLLEESSWLLGIQTSLEKCRFSHFHSCKSNNFLARGTD